MRANRFLSVVSFLFSFFIASHVESKAQDGLVRLNKYELLSTPMLEEVRKVVESGDFKSQEGVPNLGVTNDWHYIKFQLKRDLGADEPCIYLENPTVDFVNLYRIDSGYMSLYHSGASESYVDRSINTTGFLMNSELSEGESGVFLLVVKSGKQLIVPIGIGNRSDLYSENSSRDNLMFLYFGVMFFMFFYNLFLFLSTKDKDYLFYILYITSVGLTQCGLFGYGDKYLWPNSSWMSLHGVYLFGALSGIGTIQFARKFLRTRQFTPVIDRILLFYVVLDLVSIGLAVSGNFNLSYNLINFNAASALILLIAGFVALRKGNSSAKYFLVAWSIFLVSVTIFAFKDFGILPYNNFTVYALPIGSAFEGVLLSFALADKINIFKHEKERSQERMILVMQENQALITDQNSRLERMVNDRTQDLEKANYELNSTLRNLKVTQKQLVESEKLASLGQMTAGIAHEINNPINFVSSNIQPLKRDVKDILYLLDEYAQAGDADALIAKLPELQKKYKDLDIEFLKKEIEMLLGGIEEGSRRTAEIVKGLRIFSRMDRDTLVSANINECINSTLVVMKSLTKGEVTIVKEYSDNLPALDCFPGKLNQVFMNILTNAVQATKLDGRQAPDRKIDIKTACDENSIIVTITDNGMGMDEAVKAKIFDPFFTTKSVGEGTGLGLSIAMGIVSEHNGKIEVNSQVGKGTQFLITLPRLQSVTSKAA